jgi:hypothetical protein
MTKLFAQSKLMKRFALVILVLLFAHPVFATSFTITDGIYNPILGPSLTVTGKLELGSSAGSDVFGGFFLAGVRFNLEGFDQFDVSFEETDFPGDYSCWLDWYPNWEDQNGFYYDGYGAVTFAKSERISSDLVRALEYEGLFLDVTVYNAFPYDNTPNQIIGTFHIESSADPVPEPTSILWLTLPTIINNAASK